MFTAENSITINRPPAEVFAYVSDPMKFHEWRPMVLEVLGFEPPIQSGSTYTLAENLMGRKEYGQHVTTYEPDRLLVVETTSGSVRPVQRYAFEPASRRRHSLLSPPRRHDLRNHAPLRTAHARPHP
jgi:hypothetical protein